jgi:hypothetical protein
MIAIVVEINRKSMKLLHFVTFFKNLSMLNISFGFLSVGAGAESRNGSGFAYTKMMRLLAAPATAPQKPGIREQPTLNLHVFLLHGSVLCEWLMKQKILQENQSFLLLCCDATANFFYLNNFLYIMFFK